MHTSDNLAFKSPFSAPARPENKLLARLGSELERLLPRMRDVELEAGTVLFKSGDPAVRVFFPIDCVVSITSAPSGGVDVALVGPDGFVAAAPLGTSVAVFNAVVQVSGRLAVVEANALHALSDASPACRSLLERWQNALVFQSQQIAACNAIHDVEKRLCRWLLQFHDRTGLGMLPVTQEMLATMLGVQRTTVTLVAHRLRSRGVLRQRRGRIELIDTGLLEQSACDCHRRIKTTCEAIMQPTSEPSRSGEETPAPAR